MPPAYLDPRIGRNLPARPAALVRPRPCAAAAHPAPRHHPRADRPGRRAACGAIAPRFPLQPDDPITLGEGMHAAAPPHLHGADVLLKCEWLMPTGSFKDRGASVMLSLLRAQGITAVLEDSSGNGGAAVAAYAAAGGHARHHHGARLHQPGQDGADARARRHAGTDPRHPPGHRRRRGARARRRSSTPATTGTRSSCTAPRRWPTNCGRTSASARPTTSSCRAAPAPTCWAARSAFPNCCAPARSTRCRASSPSSRPTAPRSPPPSWPAPTRRSPPTIAPDHRRGHRHRPADPAARGARRAARNPRRRGDADRAGNHRRHLRPGAHRPLRRADRAQPVAAFAKLLQAGTITPEQTTVLVLTGSGLKATPRIADLLDA